MPPEVQPEKFYLTTPIYYVNARPHIGHAYSTIVADVLARRHRLLGHDTFFLTGTDEHGQKIERSAAAAGIPPQEFADQVSKTFSDLWARMGITNDAFIRTTDPDHKQGAQKLFQTLYDQGHIYLSTYTGQYSIGEEMFVDGPPGTIGPDGRPTETVTEENFFFRLSDFQQPLLDLIESNTLKITPESSRNEVLSFLRGPVSTVMQSFVQPMFNAAEMEQGEQKALTEEAIVESVSKEFYVPGALKNLSVSRSSFTWGIPVPDDVQQKEGTTQPHVIYVWLDALANYMTAIGYGSDSEADKQQFKKYWPANLHLVGKEITRFHCVYWPAFLLALNPKLNHKSTDPMPTLTLDEHKAWAAQWLPKQVTANGWLLFDNSKMSKSKGNVVRAETILEAFGEHVYAKQFPESTKAVRDLFAGDILRYYLLREIPFGQDGSFTFEAMITRYNADLANGYGNLVSRVVKMIEQYFNGKLPSVPVTRSTDRTIFLKWWETDPFVFTASFDDKALANETLEQATGEMAFIAIRDGRGRVGMALYQNLSVAGGDYFYSQSEHLTIREFLQVSLDPLIRAYNNPATDLLSASFLLSISGYLRVIDEMLTVTKPWKLENGDPRRLDILNAAAESIRILTALLYPVIPNATTKVWAQLGLGALSAVLESELKWGALQAGLQLGPLTPIFPRADKSLAALMVDMELASAIPTKETRMPTEDTSQQPAASATHPAEPLKTQGLPEPWALNPEPSPFDPAAPPRTSTLETENPGAHVAASQALTTGPAGIPTHTEAPASGISAGRPTTPPAGPWTLNPEPSQIGIDDFTRIDLRVAKILVAERIPKADKLLRLEVDLGYEQRQILSGIAEHYTPEELIGRKIVIIANLAPRKMRGLESRGMLLAASEGENGKPILATFADDIAVGTRLR